MILYVLFPLAWGAVTAVVVAACQVASRADGRPQQAEFEPGELAP